MDIRELEDFKLSDAVKFHDELNPALWKDDKLRPEVREQLLTIADDFLSELGISGLKVKDITVSGSNAAYTYTPYSDLDLHILVDFKELPNDEIYQELFTAKKSLYNDGHDIKVHGVPVELYVQDSNQPVVSIGEYSLKNNEWLRFPSKRRANFSQTATRAKYEKLGSMIELAIQSDDIDRVEKVLDIIKSYRKAGLSSTGEFGPENLAFKALRNMGLIKKLYTHKGKLHSKELSIDEVLDTQPTKQHKAKWDFSFPESGLEDLKFTASNGVNYSLNFMDPYMGPTEINDYELLPKNLPDSYYDRGKFVEFSQIGKRGKEKQGIEGTGAAAEVFGIVTNGILNYIKKKKPSYLYFQAAEPNRQSLYSKIIKKILPLLPNWKLNGPTSDGVYMLYSMPKGTKSLEEVKNKINFDPVVKDILEILPDAKEIWFHGSRAIGKHKRNSDIDVLVIVPNKTTPDEYLDINRNLHKLSNKHNNFDIQPSHENYNIHRIAKEEGKLLYSAVDEDYDPNGPPPGPEFKPTMPKGTVRVDVSDVYDWYKLGQHISNMKGLGKHDFGKGPPSTILSFGDEDLEHQYIQALKKTGLDTTDIDPKAHDTKKGQKVDPTYNVGEGLGGADTSWSDGNEKITLQDILELTKNIQQIDLPINDNLKSKLLHWDGNPEEIERINQVVVSKQFPILVMLDKQGQIDWILDGNHRLHKAIQSQAQTIPAKLIRPSDLSDKAKKVFHINETFDKPYPLTWETGDYGDVDALAQLDDGTYLHIMFDESFMSSGKHNDTMWDVQFYRDNSQDITGKGDSQRVFATVLEAIKQFVKKYEPPKLFFSSVKEDDPKGNRTKLYKTLVDKFASSIGYEATVTNFDRGTGFKLTRKSEVQESSGYIPSEKEKNDPRFKTALTKDVKPDSIKKNAKAFMFKTSRAGIPPLLRK